MDPVLFSTTTSEWAPQMFQVHCAMQFDTPELTQDEGNVVGIYSVKLFLNAQPLSKGVVVEWGKDLNAAANHNHNNNNADANNIDQSYAQLIPRTPRAPFPRVDRDQRTNPIDLVGYVNETKLDTVYDWTVMTPLNFFKLHEHDDEVGNDVADEKNIKNNDPTTPSYITQTSPFTYLDDAGNDAVATIRVQYTGPGVFVRSFNDEQHCMMNGQTYRAELSGNAVQFFSTQYLVYRMRRSTGFTKHLEVHCKDYVALYIPTHFNVAKYDPAVFVGGKDDQFVNHPMMTVQYLLHKSYSHGNPMAITTHGTTIPVMNVDVERIAKKVEKPIRPLHVNPQRGAIDTTNGGALSSVVVSYQIAINALEIEDYFTVSLAALGLSAREEDWGKKDNVLLYIAPMNDKEQYVFGSRQGSEQSTMYAPKATFFGTTNYTAVLPNVVLDGTTNNTTKALRTTTQLTTGAFSFHGYELFNEMAKFYPKQSTPQYDWFTLGFDITVVLQNVVVDTTLNDLEVHITASRRNLKDTADVAAIQVPRHAMLTIPTRIAVLEAQKADPHNALTWVFSASPLVTV